MGNLPFEPTVVVLLMIAVLIVLGMFMDWGRHCC
jgi:TRAP-type C4-dicarboxylate transport system permease large subunit